MEEKKEILEMLEEFGNVPINCVKNDLADKIIVVMAKKILSLNIAWISQDLQKREPENYSMKDTCEYWEKIIENFE